MEEKLSAPQIEAMLKPMMDFAPAIMRAAEIVAEAKTAEGRIADSRKILADQANQIASLHESIASLEKRRDAAKGGTSEALGELEAFKRGLDVDRKKVRAEFQADLDSIQTAKRSAEAELRDLQGSVAVQKAELDAVTKAFHDFKKAHAL